jgi:hypothetical protein
MSTDTPGARVAPVSISPKVFERYRSPVVDGNPVVVVGGKDGKSENDERPPSDEERARATLCDRAEERQFVERRRPRRNYSDRVGDIRCAEARARSLAPFAIDGVTDSGTDPGADWDREGGPLDEAPAAERAAFVPAVPGRRNSGPGYARTDARGDRPSNRVSLRRGRNLRRGPAPAFRMDPTCGPLEVQVRKRCAVEPRNAAGVNPRRIRHRFAYIA